MATKLADLSLATVDDGLLNLHARFAPLPHAMRKDFRDWATVFFTQLERTVCVEFALLHVIEEPLDKRPGNDSPTSKHDQSFDSKPYCNERREREWG